MEEKDFYIGRIDELADKAYQNEYVTHTDFLSLSEQSDIYEIMQKEGQNYAQGIYKSSAFIMFGGHMDFERAMLFFLPSYLNKEDFLEQEQYLEAMICLEITPVNRKFSDDLGHRDYLGALMNLGITRNQIGDIIFDKKQMLAYVFVCSEMQDLICNEMIRIKHTSVKCRKVSFSECQIVPEFEEIVGSVSSLRLDVILALVYRLSRSQVGELIDSQKVFVNGKEAYSGGYDLKEAAVISVRGYGKFVFEGREGLGTSRKGKLYVKVKKFI